MLSSTTASMLASLTSLSRIEAHMARVAAGASNSSANQQAHDAKCIQVRASQAERELRTALVCSAFEIEV